MLEAGHPNLFGPMSCIQGHWYPRAAMEWKDYGPLAYVFSIVINIQKS